VSATTARLPTGPTIVLCASALVLVSLLAAPGRGLVAGALRVWRGRRALQVAGVLEDLYTLALQHPDPAHGHPAATLRTMTMRPESVTPTLTALHDRGLVAPVGEDAWALTPDGLAQAERLSGRRAAEEAR
jgi:manganese/zinc/iron transport system permease protein